MDAGDDIIDVLYRCNDRSNSPMQQTLTRSRTVRHDDNIQEHQEIQRRRIQQQVSAPQPPRNYERDLYNFNRQSFAYRGNARQSDSVFHRQDFNPANRQSFYQHTRSRRYSGNNEDGTTTTKRQEKNYQGRKTKAHKSEDDLDIDFEKSRSIRVDVLPRLEIDSKDNSDDLILMPNGTRQRRTKITDATAIQSTKTSLHRTDNHPVSCLSTEFSDVGLTRKGLVKDETYSTAAAVLESDIYENVQNLSQSSNELPPLDRNLQKTSGTESNASCFDNEMKSSSSDNKILFNDGVSKSNDPRNINKLPNTCAVHQIFENRTPQKKKTLSSLSSYPSSKTVRLSTLTLLSSFFRNIILCLLLRFHH